MRPLLRSWDALHARGEWFKVDSHMLTSAAAAAKAAKDATKEPLPKGCGKGCGNGCGRGCYNCLMDVE